LLDWPECDRTGKSSIAASSEHGFPERSIRKPSGRCLTRLSVQNLATPKLENPRDRDGPIGMAMWCFSFRQFFERP
jgi:hypothetical protein